MTSASAHFNGQARLVGNAIVSAVENTVAGAASTTGNARFLPAVRASVGTIPDPLQSLPLPPSTARLSSRSNPCTQGPGIYDGVSLNGSASCPLSPSLYVIRSGTWSLSGNVSMTGTGVTL